MSQEVLQEFKEEVGELFDELDSGLAALSVSPEDVQAAGQLFRTAHTMAAAAAMYGLETIQELAQGMEVQFDRMRQTGHPASPAQLAAVAAAKDAIFQCLEDPAACGPERLEDVRRLLDEAAVAEEDVSGPESPAPAAAAPGAVRTYRIRFKVPAPRTLVHADPLAPLDELRQLGRATVVLRLEDLPFLGDLDPESCSLWWEVTLETEAEEQAVRDAFLFFEADGEVSVRLETEASDAAPAAEEKGSSPVRAEVRSPVRQSDVQASQVRIPTPISMEPKAAWEALEMGEEESEPAQRRERTPGPRSSSASSIRVDAYKLDDIMTLVGEMVIAQARLNQTVERLGDPGLITVAEEMDRLSASLRDRATSLRMLPIGTTFDRFRRLVRDLSKETGKEIEFSARGAETELDKSVIEQLGDPLTHLLRNCIDHGIEPPAERMAQGKPQTGRIFLSAEHSGSDVLIRIQDDGRGLDRERILTKALGMGLVADPDALSDKEVFDLAFHPGLTTADQVNGISGRGVGMDVVRRGVAALRGVIDLASEPGKGTGITIKLPLTLAIIEGLMVRVGEEYYVIPLAAVEECVELTGKDRDGDGRKRIINIRGEIVPYIRLREWFEIPGELPDIEQIVVTGGGGSLRTGIVVDEVVGQQQTVIKSLSAVYKDVEEISGATIRGDGSLALILDVAHLARLAMDTRAS